MDLDDKDLISIPIDEIALEIDDTGMPKAVPGSKPATGPTIESTGEPEPKAKAKPDPRLSALEQERDTFKAERDRLAAQAAAERAARQEALAERDTLGSRLEKVTGQGIEAHRTAVRERYQRTLTEAEHVKSGITQAKSMLDQARADLRAAHTAGDADRIADLTEHIGRVAGQLTQLEASAPTVESYVNQYKTEYENTERTIAEAEQKRTKAEAEPQPKTQTIEEWIAASPAETQPFLNKNKDLLRDPVGYDKVNTFAKLYALDHGSHALHSKAFAEALEAKFNPKPKVEIEEEEAEDVADADTQETQEEPKPAARKSTPAAPVSRNATPAKPQGGGAGSIKLSPDQYAIAPDLYPAGDYDGFSAETKKKFPAWSETAARYQYHQDLQRAKQEKGHRFT